MSKRAIFLSGKRGGGASGPTTTTTTTTWQVSASGDDGWASHSTSGTFFNANQSSVVAGFYVAGGSTTVGTYGFFRFTGVEIPQGATIDTAKLTLVTSPAPLGAEYGDLDLHTFKVDALDVDDSAQPSSATDANDSVASTEAIVDWSLTSSVADDADLDTPEIKTVVQEIVDRGGWAADNDMTFRVYSEETDSSNVLTPDCRLNVQTHDLDSDNAAKLVVTYTA